MLSSPHPPMAVLSAMGTLVNHSSLRIESKTHFDESIRVLQEVYGTCQRILTTPIPLSYTRWDKGCNIDRA
jgi:predicted membrane chloride channel (bestrophin family)